MNWDKKSVAKFVVIAVLAVVLIDVLNIFSNLFGFLVAGIIPYTTIKLPYYVMLLLALVAAPFVYLWARKTYREAKEFFAEMAVIEAREELRIRRSSVNKQNTSSTSYDNYKIRSITHNS